MEPCQVEPFIVLNWNVGGAKFLDLPSGQPRERGERKRPDCREEYREWLMDALAHIFREYARPHVICLQEIVQYAQSGKAEDCLDLFDEIEGYTYFPHPLIDTDRFGATAKWDVVNRRGGWEGKPFFAQGNGFLVADDCRYYPMLSLANGEDNTPHSERQSPSDVRGGVERVDLHPGLYFGNRNSEPRAAFVLHIVRPTTSGKPLDIFVVNLHLTTLKGEREGIPDIDEKASQIRINQLKVVLDNCVSQYNEWRNNDYVFSGRGPNLNDHNDTTDRHNPIWILAGDFNFTPDSAEYQYLTRRNFVDLHHQDPTKSSGIGKDPTITVDYIFAGPKHYSIKGKLEESHTKNNKVFTSHSVRVSDHYPILAHVSKVFENQLS